MDIMAFKDYLFENEKVVTVLSSLGCHHIRQHGNRIVCTNPDGDNQQAVNVFLPSLSVVNYTRDLDSVSKYHDIFTLVQFYKEYDFFDALKYVCDCVGVDPYQNFEEDIPEELILIKLAKAELSGDNYEPEKPLSPIPEQILTYYLPYVNDYFKNDGISYDVQKTFEIGYDQCTNRITIPIRNYDGKLIGVKGRWFGDIPEDSDIQKYLYLEPCNKGQVLFGLDKSYDYIRYNHCVYVGESEKFVMQLFSYGDKNCVSTGGKTITRHQIEMLSRMCVDVVLCLDKDVNIDELKNIADKFIGTVNVFAVMDNDGLLNEHESPSDNKDKWQQLKESVVKIR